MHGGALHTTTPPDDAHAKDGNFQQPKDGGKVGVGCNGKVCAQQVQYLNDEPDHEAADDDGRGQGDVATPVCAEVAFAFGRSGGRRGGVGSLSWRGSLRTQLFGRGRVLAAVWRAWHWVHGEHSFGW